MNTLKVVGLVHMLCDWMAMNMPFPERAVEYYDKKKDEIGFPKEVEDFIYQVFDRLTTKNKEIEIYCPECEKDVFATIIDETEAECLECGSLIRR